MFEGNLALRGVFESAQSSIAIADPYVGPRLFNLLTARHAGVMIRILSNKISPADLQAAQDFNAEYGHLQLRLQKTGMHDRFVITTLLRPDDRGEPQWNHLIYDTGLCPYDRLCECVRKLQFSW